MNQCMGCQAGWPLTVVTLRGRNRTTVDAPVHRVPDGYPGEVVGCTRGRYER
jgi:hypothetical protein